MENKYEKIIYQSEPIGKEKIILYLTTLDYEKLIDDDIHEQVMKFINEDYLFDRPTTINDVKRFFKKQKGVKKR